MNRRTRTRTRLAVLLLVLGVTVPAPAQIQFQDRTASVGYSYTGQTLGLSFGDYNGDGRPDLWIAKHRRVPDLLENVGGFEMRTVPHIYYMLPPGADTHGAAFADCDGDGDQDLIQVLGAKKGTGYGPNFLLRNEGPKGFMGAPATLGVRYSLGRGRTPLWLDWNQDGTLDLFFANKLRPDADAPSAVFVWSEGHYHMAARFPDSINAQNSGYGQLADLTNDGQVDLLIGGASDGLRVYQLGVEGGPDLAPSLLLDGFEALDTIAADFDGDLDVDLYAMLNSRVDNNRLYYQTSGLFREDKGVPKKLPNVTATVSGVAADFDNDMDLDMYLVLTDHATNRANVLLENLGQREFAIVPSAGGAEGTLQGIGESVACADLDGDGYLDLVVTNGKRAHLKNLGPVQFFQNQGQGNHWVGFDLRGTTSNPDGIGARVIVTVNGVSQLREQGGGMHGFSQNHSRLHFGLGANTVVDSVQVEWPDGTLQILTDLAADQVYVVTESD